MPVYDDVISSHCGYDSLTSDPGKASKHKPGYMKPTIWSMTRQNL